MPDASDTRARSACALRRDVVYFDPMWVVPSRSSPSFQVLRKLAHSERLSASAIAQARRVARRKVVVMDQIHGGELERLGLPVHTCGQRKRYGCLPGSCAQGPPPRSCDS